jgi:acyl-CoA reductase-like NAD-dependent aldehyde dehydrogenase
LEEAVAAATRAFAAWSARPLQERGALLAVLADALEAAESEFACLLTEEQGKPLSDALGEIALAIAVIRYFARLDLPLAVLKEDASPGTPTGGSSSTRWPSPSATAGRSRCGRWRS